MAKKLTPGRPMEKGDLGLGRSGRPMVPGDIGLGRGRQMVPEDIMPSEYGPPSYKRGGSVKNYCKGGKVISSKHY